MAATTPLTLSQAAVRGLLIAAQGLVQQSPNAPAATAATTTTTIDDVQRIIRQMHVLQIDTISVVARSPYFVLWSRLGEYDPRWLDALLEQGKLFEYWSHAACFLPIEDFPLYRRLRLENLKGWNRTAEWLDAHADTIGKILMHMRANGAVRSSDFERRDGKSSGWWDWKEEKMGLEMLLINHEVMVVRRHNFQRIYDLRERVLPTWDDSHAPPLDQVMDAFALKSVKALGVTRAAWVADYFRLGKPEMVRIVKRLADEGQLLRVQVEGWDEPGYLHPDHLGLAQAAADGGIPQSKTVLLSPFDPIVWDRARALDLFRFDYRIECYTPAPKRIYGYFTLPILYRNALIGRVDAKAHRKQKVFEVKALHLEPDVEIDDGLVAELRTMLETCAAWHQTPTVIVQRSEPAVLKSRLNFDDQTIDKTILR